MILVYPCAVEKKRNQKGKRKGGRKNVTHSRRIQLRYNIKNLPKDFDNCREFPSNFKNYIYLSYFYCLCKNVSSTRDGHGLGIHSVLHLIDPTCILLVSYFLTLIRPHISEYPIIGRPLK